MWVNTLTHHKSECKLRLSLSKLFGCSTIVLVGATSLPRELPGLRKLVLIKTSKEIPMNRFSPCPQLPGKPEQRGGFARFLAAKPPDSALRPTCSEKAAFEMQAAADIATTT